MFRFVVLLAIASCALGAAIPDGMLPQFDGRIVGGSTISISVAPWTVSIQRDGSHACGGSVLSNNVVITAAHCIAATQITALRVRIGSTFTNFEGNLITVTNMKYHEEYNPITMENDIAVVRLSSSTSYNTNFKNLDLAYYTPSNGAFATATGWGSQTYGGTKSETLQQVAVNIISQTNCASSTYGYGSEVKATMICAAAVGKDACQGESGGPLASDGLLVGIVSWGYGCAYSSYPGVYTNTAMFRNWILSAASSV